MLANLSSVQSSDLQDLNYHHLYYFWLVAQHRSFSRAAEKLRVSQSAISQQVQSLERQLGAPLFLRQSRRSFSLTEEGQLVLELATTIFSTGRELVRRVKSQDEHGTETLKVGAVPGMSRTLQLEFLKPLLGRDGFNVHIATGEQEHLLEALSQYRLDVILTSHGLVDPIHSDLQVHPLVESPLVLVCAQKSPWLKRVEALILKKRARSSDVGDRTEVPAIPIFIPSVNLDSRARLDALLQNELSPLRVAAEIDDIPLLRLIATAGLGPAIIPKIGVLNEIQSQELTVLKEYSKTTQAFYAITRKRKSSQPLVHGLIQTIRQL